MNVVIRGSQWRDSFYSLVKVLAILLQQLVRNGLEDRKS